MRIHSNRFLHIVLVATFALAGATYASAAETDLEPTTTPTAAPIGVDDNPSCSDVGYDFGFKIDAGPFNGTFTSGDGYLVVSLVSADGVSFDWASSIGIDAVIVKGGPNANLYVYDPPAESFGDTGLTAPINPNNGTPYAISHIEFCYDFELTVSKDATTTFTRTYEWDIAKSVTPDSWDLFTGDTGTSRYAVNVTRTGFTDSEWAVSGSILIVNDTPIDARVVGVTDEISPGMPLPVDCPVSIPTTLAPGDSLTCTYGGPLPDGTSRVNTATVTTDPAGVVNGGYGTADVVFGAPTEEVHATVHVTDSNGGLFEFAGSGEVSYEHTFGCDDEGTNTNTATIDETGQSAEATVTVTCHDLSITKDATTSFDRAWLWTIDKAGDASELTLSQGQQHVVNYLVTVDATSVDSAWAVSGDITISNPHPTRDAVLTDVSDLVSTDIDAEVDCDVLTVPARGTLTCSYTADLPDASARTNVATATLQNYAFDPDGTATANGTTDVSSTAVDVVFGDTPTREYDECIDVSDTLVGPLGRVCADDVPLTFVYARQIGPYDVCGEYVVENIASFVSNDTGAVGSDSWIVDVTVPCDGCTLTPGYWKTHSEYGPAPYDDTWALLPNGADTKFFETGYSYYEMLKTPSAKGNAYVILSRAYIAAELNVLNGSTIPPDVLDAWQDAGALLVEYEHEVDIPKRDKVDRADAIRLARVLDDYNNGLLGPGHCSE